jgi:hypothetical protein
LLAAGPAPEHADKMDTYAWLIGAWLFEMTEYAPERGERHRHGEWHFAWVLQGRAIQDVWIVPPRGTREGDVAAPAGYYGSTLRVYDPRIDAWRIQWTEPVSQLYLSMVGRREGGRIVQDGHLPDGRPIRWSFNDVSRDSFVWRSEIRREQGDWWRNVEFKCHRTTV